MSADGARKAYRYTCNMVRPQIYSEKSLVESVVDFFSDVVPQAYSGTQKVEDKEKIQWVRFETCDCNDISKNPDLYRSDTKGLPLLLILGYSNGVQIWHVTSNGEAQEIMSIRQGPVRIFRLLPLPDPVLGHHDAFANKRPLAVMCDSSSAGQPYCGIKFVSLKTGDEVHSINYKTLPVQTIECNKRFLVTVFLEKICVYEACQYQQLFWVTSCFPCPGPNVNPVALSTRWLAYADKRLVAMHQSCGGMSGDGSQSYAATVISAAKGAFKGLSMFGEAMVSSVTGCKSPGMKKQEFVQLDNSNRPGIVTVVDIQNVHNDHFNVNEDNEGSGLIAHFHAHANEPVANMAFDQTGTLLVTTCKLGHNFHVFRLMAHPCSSAVGAVHHLYTLHRGDTTAKVIDISFNHDSRWVTVSTHRGTTHIFPITPYGGPINVRTHCQPYIVNRASRFHKSAGLEDIERSPMGRSSPVLSTSPSSSGQYDRYPTLIQQNTLNNNFGNPRLPPYPHPITIYPLYQIKQPLNVVLNPNNKNQSPSHSPTGTDNVYSVCAMFCSPRLCVIGSPKLDVERREGGRRPVDSLFIMTQSGSLVEYVLEPRARTVLDKITEDCNLDLGITGRMQWNLQRLKASQELRPPLPNNSPLLLATEAVVSQIPTASDLCDHIGLTRQDSKDSLSSDHSNKDDDEQWLSQVEIITHAGPHRRLWMGPQFSFKTYQENTTVLSSNSSSLLSQSPETNMGAMDIMGEEGDLESLKVQPARSNPVTMPTTRPAYRRLSGSDSSPSPGLGQITPLMIEAGSFDQSPHLLDVYSNWTESTVEKQPRGSDDVEEDRLKQTLADAMVESPMKDIDKLSLRQDLSRSDVKDSKKKSKTDKEKVQCVPEVTSRNSVTERKTEKRAEPSGKLGGSQVSKSRSKEKVKAEKDKSPVKSDVSKFTTNADLKKSNDRGKVDETNKSREQTPSAQGSEAKCKSNKKASTGDVLPKSSESLSKTNERESNMSEPENKIVLNKTGCSNERDDTDVKNDVNEKKQSVKESNQKDSKSGKKETSKGKDDGIQIKGSNNDKNKSSTVNARKDFRNGKKKSSVKFAESFEDENSSVKAANTSFENISGNSSQITEKSARKSLKENYDELCDENLNNGKDSVSKSNYDIESEIIKNKNVSSNNFSEASIDHVIDEIEPLETVDNYFDPAQGRTSYTEQTDCLLVTESLELEQTDKTNVEIESDLNVIENIDQDQTEYPNFVETKKMTSANTSEEARNIKVKDVEEVTSTASKGSTAPKEATQPKKLRDVETEKSVSSKDKKKKKGRNGSNSESKISDQREPSAEKSVIMIEEHKKERSPVSYEPDTMIHKEAPENIVGPFDETRNDSELKDIADIVTFHQIKGDSPDSSCNDNTMFGTKQLTKDQKKKQSGKITAEHAKERNCEPIRNCGKEEKAGCVETDTRWKVKKDDEGVSQLCSDEALDEADAKVLTKNTGSKPSTKSTKQDMKSIEKDVVSTEEVTKVSTNDYSVSLSNKDKAKDKKKNKKTDNEIVINRERKLITGNEKADKEVTGNDDLFTKTKKSSKKENAETEVANAKKSVTETKQETIVSKEMCEDFPALDNSSKTINQDDMFVVKSKKSRRKAAAAAAAKLEESQYFDTTDCLKDPDGNTAKNGTAIAGSEQVTTKNVKSEEIYEIMTDGEEPQSELDKTLNVGRDGNTKELVGTAQSTISNEYVFHKSENVTIPENTNRLVEKSEKIAEDDDMFVVKSKRKKKKNSNAMEESIFESAIEDIKPQETDKSVYIEATSDLPSVEPEEIGNNKKVKNENNIKKEQDIVETILEKVPENKVLKKESRISIAKPTFSYASCLGLSNSNSNQENTKVRSAKHTKDSENNIVLPLASNVVDDKKVSSGTLETFLSTETSESKVDAADEETSWETAAMADDDDDDIQVIEDSEAFNHGDNEESEQHAAFGVSMASNIVDHKVEQVLSSASDRSSEEREYESKVDNTSERSSEERDAASKPMVQKSEPKSNSNKKKKKKNRK